MTLFLGYSVQPSLLANNVGTTLEGVFTSGTDLANQLLQHAHGFVPPGLPGEVHVPYKYVSYLAGAVARSDGSAAAGAINPLRGRWHETWLDVALVSLDGLGAFSGARSPFQGAPPALSTACRGLS